MPQFFPLCLQIPLVVFIDRGNDRNLINDTQIESTQIERFRLFRVVGQQPYLVQTQILEDLKSDSVVTHVCFESQSVIRLDRVQSIVL